MVISEHHELQLGQISTWSQPQYKIFPSPLIVNNVTKGYSETCARVLYFINNENDVFDNDFQMPRLSAPKSFSKL